MKEWFDQLEQREQLAVLVGGVAVFLYVLVFAVWQPVQSMRDEMAAQNVRVTESLRKVQTMAGKLQQLQQGGGAKRQRNLVKLINSSTSKHGITPSRIQNNTRGDTQVRFEDVKFSDLLRWLHQVEYVERLVVRDVSMTQGEKGGLVDASIRLGQGS